MRKLGVFMLAILMGLSTLLTACTDTGASGGGTTEPISDIVLEEGKTYSNQISKINENYAVVEKNYNSDIFYVNDAVFNCADPFVFQCTDETDIENYGKFYLLGTFTPRAYNCWESTDLVSWKQKAAAYTVPADGWEVDSNWAPEVTWDAEANREDYGLDPEAPGTGVYFMFYSAQPCDRFLYFTNSVTEWQMGLAVSTCPYGPYKMWNGNEEGATIGGVNYGTQQNYAAYTTYKDNWATHESAGRKGNTVTNDDSWFNQSAARASLAFQWEHRSKAGKWVDPNGNIVTENTANATYISEGAAHMVVDESQGAMACFDPSPFVDPLTGQKYLFFSVSNRGQPVQTDSNGLPLFKVQSTYAFKMLNNDWAQIDYSSVTRITRALTNFISQAAADDYCADAAAFDASAYPKGYDEGDNLNLKLDYASAEKTLAPSAGVNEGPTVVYNEESGLYYLTCSIGQYTDGTYSVVQSIAYSPMGPFRKVGLEEGGVVLGNFNQNVINSHAGPGHHSFIKVGDEMLICYHTIANLNHGGGRSQRIDRVVWTTNNDGLTILYTNGPTKTPQLKFYGYDMDYKNIAGDATITIDGNNYVNEEALTDGIITMNNDMIHNFVKEFEFTDEEIVINIKFNEFRTITGLMVYNSHMREHAFYRVKRIEMNTRFDTVTTNVIIKNLVFDWDQLVTTANIVSGSSAIAVFNELSVNEITLTIKNTNIGDDPELYSGVIGISEVVVIGVPN